MVINISSLQISHSSLELFVFVCNFFYNQDEKGNILSFPIPSQGKNPFNFAQENRENKEKI